MKSFVFALVAVLAIASAKQLHLTKEELGGNTWAVVVSGAAGWDNYRMQADVCHSYHVFHDRFGIPDERIIVMMVDDIAMNPQNPYPGKVINDIDGEDVYAGVPHDYTGKYVTPQNFAKLLIGEEIVSGGKTLQSTSEDNVIVHFSDHGGQGCLCFPNDVFSTYDMQNALNTMASKGMYKNLVLYIDACYSGSVFYKTSIPENVYVATAAPVGEYAYSCYYDSSLGNFPCDQFSHNFMTDMEQNNHGGYTFNDEFSYVQSQCDFSQVCRYGNIDGFGGSTINSFFNLPDYGKLPTAKGAQGGAIRGENRGYAQIDVPLVLAQLRYEHNASEANRQKLEREITIRKAIDTMIDRVSAAAKPGMGGLTLDACSTCDNSCPCYQYCLNEHSADFCSTECCNEQAACYSDAPPGHNAQRRDSCIKSLADAYISACGLSHDYLRKFDGMIPRLCKREGVNVASAVQEIRKQCNIFKMTAF